MNKYLLLCKSKEYNNYLNDIIYINFNACKNLNLIPYLYKFIVKKIKNIIITNKKLNYLCFVFKKPNLKINCQIIASRSSIHYSVGSILRLLIGSFAKNMRKDFKGIKLLVNFLSRKTKKYANLNFSLNILGINKFMVKTFYLFNKSALKINIYNILWIPINSWTNKNRKKIRSIRRRTKRQIIFFEKKK